MLIAWHHHHQTFSPQSIAVRNMFHAVYNNMSIFFFYGHRDTDVRKKLPFPQTKKKNWFVKSHLNPENALGRIHLDAMGK